MKIQADTVFISVAVVSIIALFVIVSFFQSLVQSNTDAVLQNAGITDTSISPQEALEQLQEQKDPLVTKIPKEILGNTPQPLETDPIRGAKDAKITIVEFGDFQCGKLCKNENGY